MSIRDITYLGEGIIPEPIHGPALRHVALPRRDVTDIAVHHWTGWLPPETWTANEEIAYSLRIDQYHRTGRGLDGIGYHICPFPSGNIYIVSRLDRYGAHVGGENNHLIGIGLPGTFNLKAPTSKHLAATVEAVRYAYDYLGRDIPTKPHLNWGGTTCPGERWPEWVPQLRAQALMTEEDDDMPLLIKRVDRGEIYVAVFTEKGAFKMHVPNQATFDALGFDMRKVQKLPAPVFGGFKTIPWGAK